MARARNIFICSLGAAAVLATLWGCNGSNVDDPTKSDSLLVIDSVSPSSVQADVTPDLDPNGVLPPTPPPDDIVEVNVRNLNRAQTTSGIYGDIMITSVELLCHGSIPSSTTAASLTIPAESSATISVLLVDGPWKALNSASLLTIGHDICQITFNGQDLSGEPILSTIAVVGVSFVDNP